MMELWIINLRKIITSRDQLINKMNCLFMFLMKKTHYFVEADILWHIFLQFPTQEVEYLNMTLYNINFCT